MPAGLIDRVERRDTRPRRFMVVWQDPETRAFHHVARLEFTADGEFRFSYVSAARLASRFRPFAAFPDLDHEYRSDDLFPFFANRVMSSRRSDFDAHLSVLGLTRADWTPLELLARSAGERATDTVQVVEEPLEEESGRATVVFPVSGVRHIEGAEERISALHPRQELALRREPENPEDLRAVLIDVSRNAPVGYVPSYLLDFLYKRWDGGMEPQVYVERANGPDAPWHLRLLCCLVVDPAS